jgi:hypothetical protein
MHSDINTSHQMTKAGFRRSPWKWNTHNRTMPTPITRRDSQANEAGMAIRKSAVQIDSPPTISMLRAIPPGRDEDGVTTERVCIRGGGLAMTPVPLNHVLPLSVIALLCIPCGNIQLRSLANKLPDAVNIKHGTSYHQLG